MQYLQVNYFAVLKMQNRTMDKYAIRREALRKLIANNYGGINASFAKVVDIDESYVSRLLYPDDKAGRKRIGEDTVEKISRVHPGWLTPQVINTKNSPLFSAEQPHQEYGNIGEKIALRGSVPIISYVQAGNWSEAMDTFVAGDADQWVETTYKAKRYTYALRVEGDSMEPRFPAGAILIVEPEEEAKNGSFVIVRQNGSEATFKQLIIDGGQKYLKPLNDRYPIMPMRDDAVMCGVVKQMVMDI